MKYKTFKNMASNEEHVLADNQKSTINKGLNRRRDADQKILDNFWHICDSSETKRNKSLKIIIEILIKQNVIIIQLFFFCLLFN